MENSALNKAHQQHRRAEAHLRFGRFAEAIECHTIATELLNEALTCTQNPRAIESIKLQKNFHIKQRDIIHVKKEQHENYKKAIENQRNRGVFNNDFEVANDSQSTTLQNAIYRTMQEADSLLGELIKKGSGSNSDCESLKSFSTDTEEKVSIDTIDSSSSNQIVGCKHPKDNSMVIEELRTLNGQLHSLVSRLVNQLDVSTKEIGTLKERVKQLENEKLKAQTKNSCNSLKVVTDSSGGTSPYVFSPCSESGPDSDHHNLQRSLPALAPLEMPSFDFTNFIKNNSNADSNINKF